MTLSVLDYIVFSMGGIIVIAYLIVKILQLKKYRKQYYENRKNGMNHVQARDDAMQKVYKKKKKSKKDNERKDKIFEE